MVTGEGQPDVRHSAPEPLPLEGRGTQLEERASAPPAATVSVCQLCRFNWLDLRERAVPVTLLVQHRHVSVTLRETLEKPATPTLA